jgi:hypothetical protein
VVTYELPIDYSSGFDGPNHDPSDDIIEFLMGVGWPKDSSRTRKTVKKLFVSFSNQSFSLATHEAGSPTLKLNGQSTTQTRNEAACAASAQCRAKADLGSPCFHGGK